jgi:hypothetical protein
VAPARRPASGPRFGPAVTLGVFVVIGVAIGTAVAVGQRSGPTPSPTRFVPPAGSAGILPPPVTGGPSASLGGQPSGVPGSVRVDPSLLAVLPSTVAGLALVEDPDTESHDAADPSHAADLAGLAVAIAADPSAADLAVASVVRLKPGVYSDEYFRSWRETFDAGACSQAGGLAGSAESMIAGRRTFIGHCAGGVLTYHVYLPAPGAIVSISSLGKSRLGELIVGGLR